MEVTDLHLRGDDLLAVEQRNHPKSAVHRRVRRSDVDRHALEHGVALVGRLELRRIDFVLGQDPATRGVVVLAQSVPLKSVVGKDAPKIRMAGELEPEEVPGLAFEPVGSLPDPDQRRQDRIGLGERHFEPQTLAAGHRIEVVDRLESSPVLVRAIGKIDSAKVEQQVETGLGVVAEVAAELDEMLARDDPGSVDPTLPGR